ncbi:hypothetical protein OG21DRAFT_1602027 [Imleria badia]|nr:hypothetical protein OG21DRAFT_1602027 [Imleria badia]
MGVGFLPRAPPNVDKECAHPLIRHGQHICPDTPQAVQVTPSSSNRIRSPIQKLHVHKIPVTLTSTSHWTIAMDTIMVNAKRVPLNSAVKGIKKDQAVINNGTSPTYIPSDAVNAI